MPIYPLTVIYRPNCEFAQHGIDEVFQPGDIVVRKDGEGTEMEFESFDPTSGLCKCSWTNARGKRYDVFRPSEIELAPDQSNKGPGYKWKRHRTKGLTLHDAKRKLLNKYLALGHQVKEIHADFAGV